jgi:hypothetical protein
MNRASPDGEEVAGERGGRGPAPGLSLLGDHEQRHQPDGQHDRAPPVDAPLAADVVELEDLGDDEQGDHGDGDVDVEDPPPPGHPEEVARPGEQAAEHRPEYRGAGEDGHHVALVAGALAGRDDIADDGQRQRHDAAGADALEGTEAGELIHGGGQAA